MKQTFAVKPIKYDFKVNWNFYNYITKLVPATSKLLVCIMRTGVTLKLVFVGPKTWASYCISVFRCTQMVSYKLMTLDNYEAPYTLSWKLKHKADKSFPVFCWNLWFYNLHIANICSINCKPLILYFYYCNILVKYLIKRYGRIYKKLHRKYCEYKHQFI